MERNDADSSEESIVEDNYLDQEPQAQVLEEDNYLEDQPASQHVNTKRKGCNKRVINEKLRLTEKRYLGFTQPKNKKKNVLKQKNMNISKLIVKFLCLCSPLKAFCSASPLPVNEEEFRYFNVGVLMASQMNYPFDLERCGPAIDMALEEVNEIFLAQHKIRLMKVQSR
ncbi:unnamed protein product [Psylliodes chrysocephalus]|uniref:Uncharacterized protein n=1 Tax=Psylliodes chrysocephalus TaxID=3402493 RepID=A0A9P0GF56_9CUCU|nr:unnamed protein product [Psylliodes chrysocephala]